MKIYTITDSKGKFIVGKFNKRNSIDYVKEYIENNECFDEITKDKKYKLKIFDKDYERCEVINGIRDLINDENCINKEKEGKYSIIRKDYTINNKDRCEYHRKYYNDNKEKINNSIKEKKYCECCNVYITKSNFTKHLKSHKHLLNSNK